MSGDRIVTRTRGWEAPVILCTCPSCGRTAERRPGSWRNRIDGTVIARLGCWPIAEKNPPCYRTWDSTVTEWLEVES